MPCACIAAACSVLSRIASRPPCTFGCSVFTRPSIISGKPVSSATSVTLSPASASALAVPPVETSSMPCRRARGRNRPGPVLSDTESSARVMRRMSWSWRSLRRFHVGRLRTTRSTPQRSSRMVHARDGFRAHARHARPERSQRQFAAPRARARRPALVGRAVAEAPVHARHLRGRGRRSRSARCGAGPRGRRDRRSPRVRTRSS